MFFFNETATTEIYTDGHTLSLHGALPFSADGIGTVDRRRTVEQNLHAIECRCGTGRYVDEGSRPAAARKASSVEENRSEAHTSEPPVTNANLVCRLLLEKKKRTTTTSTHTNSSNTVTNTNTSVTSS